MKVDLSPHFKRSYKKLPMPIKKDFNRKIKIFMDNPRHASLKTHKLKGRLQECFAFRLKNGYRVLFEFDDIDSVNLLIVGAHDIYDRFEKSKTK